MSELESSLHLYQPPLYRAANGEWRKSFVDAIGDCRGKLTWDVSAILGILGFTYTCGDRTLVNEVKRRPWLSRIGPDKEPVLEEIPAHGRLWKQPGEIADDLGKLLCNEALDVCRGKERIYLLLSGGLDSRIVAGVLARLYEQGQLAVKPVCVTWGLENCRDVFYGRMAAETLGFEWRHVNIDYRDIISNLDELSIATGALASPIHLHRMGWFKDISENSLVLSGSYGDSVGRAEFSGRHLLEIDYLKPVNAFGLIRDEVIESANNGVLEDIKSLHLRCPGQPKYITCEHEMQGHYMRNMISQVMSVINRYCSLYQMFTHPCVYSYMWSIHPAARDNSTYAELLERLSPGLARLPWARTNRALRGKTSGARTDLRKDFHEYRLWIKGPLFGMLKERIDPDWFAATGIFDPVRTKNLFRQHRIPGETLLWLAAFRRMAEHIEGLGKSVGLNNGVINDSVHAPGAPARRETGFVRQILRDTGFIYSIMNQCRFFFRRVRRFVLKRRAIEKYPPVKMLS